MYCIFNRNRWQIVDVPYGSRKEMEKRMEFILRSFPDEDLVVIEVE
jgi:hypothetical protein